MRMRGALETADAERRSANLSFAGGDVVFSGYNCFADEAGVVRGGYGLRRSALLSEDFPEGVLGAWQYGDKGCLVLTEKGFYRVYDGQKVYLREKSDVSAAVRYEKDGQSLLLLSDGKEVLSFDGASLSAEENVPPFTSAAVMSQRVFAVNGEDVLRFSALYKPCDWSEEAKGGWIRFDCGKCKAVAVFDGKLYVFCERDIVRVTAFADQRAFTAEKVGVRVGSFYAATVASCRAGILFLTEEGLRLFDGKKVRTAARFPVSGVPVACGGEQGYLAAAKVHFHDAERVLKENDDCTNNALLLYDGNLFVLRGADVNGASCFGTRALLTQKGEGSLAETDGSGTFFGEALPKSRKIGWNGGTSRKKRVRTLTVCSEKDAVLTVLTENATVSRPIAGGKKAAKIPLGVVGEKFVFVFSATGDMTLSSPHIDYDILH